MKFTWDEAKNARNRQKHGIDFADVPTVFGYPMVTFLINEKSTEKTGGLESVGWVTFWLLSYTPNQIQERHESFPHERRTDMSKASTRKKSGTDWKRLHGMKDEEIDFSDIPPIDKALFKKMVIRMPEKKAALSLRLDPRVIDWFKGQGPGYQTRINAVLKSYVEAHSH